MIPDHRGPSRLPLALALAVGLTVAAVAPSRATTVVRQTLASLTGGSEVIVRGTVSFVESRADATRPPFRLAHVTVTESVGEATPAVVPVRLPGGMTASGVQCAVAGTPDLRAGDDVVLFLTRVPVEATSRPTVAPPAAREGGAIPAGGAQPAAQWQPIGLALGAFRVAPGDGAPVVRRDPAAARLHVVGEPAEPLPDGLPATEFMARVRALREGARP